MEEYLMKYGFSGDEFGLNSFLNSDRKYSKTVAAKPKDNTDFDTTMLKNLPLTMAFVPMQRTLERYATDKALRAGTLFPELEKPFLGKRI